MKKGRQRPARRELPVLITREIASDPDALSRALNQVFDHLSGEVAQANDSLSALEESSSTVEDTATDIGEGFIDGLNQELNDAGVGTPDGAVPANAPTNVVVIGGVGNILFVVWDTVDNNSSVTYKVFVSNADPGSVPPANTFVGTWSNPGKSGGKGIYTVRQFPTGHVLVGQNPAQGTTYYARVQSTDADGDGAVSAASSGSPLTINASSILAAGTIVGGLIAAATIVGSNIAGETITAGNLAADSVTATKIIAGAITTGKLAAGAVTADKISVTTLSAIQASLGDVTGGSFKGGSYETWNNTGQPRIYIGSSSQSIKWVDDASYFARASIDRIGGKLTVDEAVNDLQLKGNTGITLSTISGGITFSADVVNGVRFQQGLRVDGRFQVGEDTSLPDGGHVTIFKTNAANTAKLKFPDGTVKEIVTI